MAAAFRIKNLEARKGALLAQSNAILDACEKEDREPTDDEQKTLDANKGELDTVLAKLTREHNLLAYSSSPEAKVIDHGSILPASPNVGNAKPAFAADPKKGFASEKEYFLAVMHAGLAGQTGRNARDERLQFLATAGSDEAGTYSDTYGGFLVPSGFMATLLARTAETDPTVNLTTKVPMSAPVVKIPARTDSTHTSSVSGGLVVYRRAETQAVSASRMAVEQVTINSHPLMGLTYATEELISDSAVSFVALIQAAFRDEFGAKVLKEKIHGTGAGTYEGVLNCPATVSVTAETGQDADSIVFENVIKMRSQCWGYQNAVWLYNHDCLPQLMQLVMTIGTSGVPMWQNSAREDRPDLLLGRPAYPSEFCATLGDAGDLILGNWSQYLEGTFQPLQSDESMHVRFEYNERAFRFLLRNDGKCWWRAALTPAKSSTTLSPFVIIEARA